MTNIFQTLTLKDFYTYAAIGAVLAPLYLFLFWQTITLYKSKKHSFILFLATTLRIFLVIFIALACSQLNGAYFLIIACSFLLSKRILLCFLTPAFKKKVKKNEIIKSSSKKIPLEKKHKRRHRSY